MNPDSLTLQASLSYTPVPLKYGTSGRRGLVADLTQLEVYINALAELEYLQSLPTAAGGIQAGEEFYFACDLRPSSNRVLDEDVVCSDLAQAIKERCLPQYPLTHMARGGLARAIEQAIVDSGMRPVFLGMIPTPALAYYAFSMERGSMMVTGSHIPFDRNGYKTNTAKGELLKQDEVSIHAFVERVRSRIYAQPFAASLFNAHGMLKSVPVLRPSCVLDVAVIFLRRYTDFFANATLSGMRLMVYQHSAVGRDFLVDLLRQFGAEVIPAGRSEVFVPIDTEAIAGEQLAMIEFLAAQAWKQYGPIDAVVSLDGDSDRPLILGVEPTTESPSGAPCRVRFFGGDLVGMIVAEYLQADAVVVPISCNDALDCGPLKNVLEPKTRIGSPYVIAGMQAARARGLQAVCGWEANGGFLLGTTLTRSGRTLRELPTRDAFLPILAVLLRAKEQGVAVSALFDQLPRRFNRAALLRDFPRHLGEQIVHHLSPPGGSNPKIFFDAANADPAQLRIMSLVSRYFSPEHGFGPVDKMDFTDGVRISFGNGDVAHLRPSGNADEMRIYAVADTQSRANDIARMGVADPGGILRRLQAAVCRERSEPL